MCDIQKNYAQIKFANEFLCFTNYAFKGSANC